MASHTFAEREEAAAGILLYGEAAIPLVAAQAEHPDPEVRLRVRVLLARLSHNDFEAAITAFSTGASDQLDGWEYAKKMIGDGKGQRELFIEATRLHREMMATLDEDSNARALATEKTADSVVHRMMVEFQPPQRGDAVALLLASADRSMPLPLVAERVIVRSLNYGITTQTMQDALLSPVYQKLIGFWVRRASDQYRSAAMVISLQHKVPESIDLALDVVKQYVDSRPKERDNEIVEVRESEILEQAILVIAKYAQRKHLDALEPLFVDARPLAINPDAPEDATVPMQIQVRDVAMAVAIKVLDGDLKEAGYTNPREHAIVVLDTRSLGFPGPEDALRDKPAKYLNRLMKKEADESGPDESHADGTASDPIAPDADRDATVDKGKGDTKP
ncbi:MAG: hypothetical protein R3C05_09095 [Pirellulaceae bacterium]